MAKESKLKTITERFPPPPWNEASSRIRAFEKGTFSEKLEIITWCVEHSTPISVNWGQNWVYSRARFFDDKSKRPNNVQDLIWPPEDFAGAGRANANGVALMYIGDREGTALAEIDMADGYAVVSEYEIQNPKGVRVVSIGEFTAIHRTGRGPFLQDQSDVVSNMLNACDYTDGLTMMLIDSFLADTMALPNIDYRITAHLAKKYLNDNLLQQQSLTPV